MDPWRRRAAPCWRAPPPPAMSGCILAEALVIAGRRGVAREVNTLVRGVGIEVVPVTDATARRVTEAYSR